VPNIFSVSFVMAMQAHQMQNGRGLAGSLLLDSPPYENLDERFPAKSPNYCE
jgi:hypothetical protein